MAPNELRTYQAYLLQERKLTPGTVVNRFAALRFALIAVCSLSLASAQETNKSTPEQPLTPTITKKVINLWPGGAPGSEEWKQTETNLDSDGMETTVNVSR